MKKKNPLHITVRNISSGRNSSQTEFPGGGDDLTLTRVELFIKTLNRRSSGLGHEAERQNS